ncbi:hypothetical protein CEXT_171761 [Caerostris extrusa]|uniref:Uncharacterized protein n=1 Tax=Caerostris extrusa TaxID=172846 RepID=A0AAV4V422_CAEEX|nr:hypothetical protein CEXT_171761 [Caerostris extrusa]
MNLHSLLIHLFYGSSLQHQQPCQKKRRQSCRHRSFRRHQLCMFRAAGKLRPEVAIKDASLAKKVLIWATSAAGVRILTLRFRSNVFLPDTLLGEIGRGCLGDSIIVRNSLEA